MIYQFDLLGNLIRSHSSSAEAVRWIDRYYYDVSGTPGGLVEGAELIEYTVRLNDEEQCLKFSAFGHYWSTFSFLGDL